MVKAVKAFEEVVEELEKKYDVHVDPRVMQAMANVVEREMKNLAKKEMLSVKGVQQYFKKAYPKIWCQRKAWPSVNNLIQQIAKAQGFAVSSEVRLELGELYSALSADTLFAAAAYVVLTRGREHNPITENDVNLVCENFLSLKPTWMC